jgi:EPS-associated MarR family transcriptional regulator
MSDDVRFELLRELTKDPAVSQRGLAARLGISVGKVNYCVRALVEKGWIKANNFRRSDNKLAYAYLLTPAGVAAKLRLTRRFIAAKEREFKELHRQVETLRRELETDQLGHKAEDRH